MSVDVTLPELGENIDGAQVLSVLVAPGDTVKKDQPLIELETDKATAEVPSEFEGVVQKIMVKQGDEIKVGQTILTLETATEAPKEKPASPRSGKKAAAPEKPKPVAPPREPEEEARPALRIVKEETEALRTAESRRTTVEDDEPARPPEIGDTVPAAPSIRRLARELGIDIAQVPGSGPGGRVSEEDVKAHARRLLSGVSTAPASPGTAAPAGEIPELPDFSRWGEVEREPASKIRRLTAEAMAVSWAQIPHVTQFDRADITDLESWRKRYAPKAEAQEAKLTLTAIAVKAVAGALKVYPRLNSSYDARTHEIVLKKYVHVGVAVDTDRGLLVPVIRDVDRKNILAIAVALNDLAQKARDRKIAAEELQGANLNVSNLGGLGTTYFSPIVTWPHVAVVGIGRANVEAVHRDGVFVPRLILPLAVSYDHRVVDGADAARFLRWVAEALEQPLLLALEG